MPKRCGKIQINTVYQIIHENKMKNLLLKVLFIINIFAIITGLVFLLFDVKDWMYTNTLFFFVRFILTIGFLFMWVWCIIIWTRNDKEPKHLLLLFLFSALYLPFYYTRIKKNKWV